MAADKFLFLSGGARSEKAGATAATPNAIPALDSSGRVPLVQMPIGIGPEAKTMKASGSITAGDFVNIYNDGGTLKARAADASTTGKEANGFVLAAYSDGEDAIVYGLSGQLNTQVTGKTLGARQYLSAAAAGKTAETAPSGDGQILQLVGKAVSATEILTVDSRIIVLAGGTPPPPAPSYWNGTDDTIEELFGTQWGITGAYFDDDGLGGSASVVNGEIIITDQAGFYNFVFDTIGAGNTFWLSSDVDFAYAIYPENGTATKMTGDDPDGYWVWKIETTGSCPAINMEPDHNKIRLWDMDPR